MIEEIKKEIKNIHWVDLGVDECDKKTIAKLLKHQEFILKILDKYNNRDNATAIIEDIISTIRDFKENDIEAICKVLLNKYRNVCGNCLKCDYFTLAKFKNAIIYEQ